MRLRNRAFPLLYPVLIITIIISFPCCRPAYPSEPGCCSIPSITADAAILMDAGTGQILFEKNAGLKKPPASTTKIMTALLALEGGDLQETVTVSPHAASVGEASLELTAGEMLTLQALLYGALLESGNDACVALAEHIGGTEGNFVLLMNQKAKLIGADSTSFKNTNGLPAADHYTTAKDLATITRYAFHNQVFKQIIGTRNIIIESSMGTRHLSNTNRLLWSYYGADGVKTGTTVEAGCCLVASAARDGRKLISVVLNSDDRWTDSIKLLDYGFERFENLRVIDRGAVVGSAMVEEGITDEVMAVASAELDVVIPRDEEVALEKVVSIERQITAPLVKGQPIGRITAKINGEVVGSVELVSDRDVDRMPNYRLFWVKRNFLPI
ncbi:D-alanyl-D-alanine carboxypeptidase DacF precursor [Pelotomaculum sp. FP]|uniref:D-alanyl-D-alanine carboxypeptidase family protein n=1 Tax=Pelotomaculum sp. FP TaxID=261474 RepID=UPI0010649832|nr:D-alanyl-D-alanine carboxypeptidase family protein [Pelotomaculum sp. FP]TEB16590.1 D-alanyl-D-alanine carboxypeptidase DacF precursor [Pelotomaculum sp. FP]